MDECVPVSFPRIIKGTGWVSLLKQRDVLLLVKTGATIGPVKLKPIEHKGKTYYEVHLDVASREGADPSIIITSKNEPQKWSSINKAVETIASLMPDLNEVVVRLKQDD